MRATNSMFIGTLFVALGLSIFGLTNLVWFAFLAITVFSLGEMLASPKFSEFLGNIAPMDKKAMYAGFSQAPIMVGFTIEGKLGPQLYHIYSAKDEFAREMLIQHGLTPAQVTEQALPVGEAFNKLVQVTGQTPDQLTQMLYQQHHVGMTWMIFAAIGLASAVMIFFYGRWLRTLISREGTSATPVTIAQPAGSITE
jgi:ABC-type multidrug transport system permease subunit